MTNKLQIIKLNTIKYRYKYLGYKNKLGKWKFIDGSEINNQKCNKRLSFLGKKLNLKT